MKNYDLFGIESHIVHASLDLDRILTNRPRVSSFFFGYSPIERTAQFLEEIKNSPDENSFRLLPIFRAITGIDFNQVIYDCRVGISREQAIKKQNPRIDIQTIAELQIQLDLGIKELRSVESLPKKRLENLRDFCIDLYDALVSSSGYCKTRHLAA